MAKLIEELSKLPGIGPKSAQRLAYHLLRVPENQAHDLASAILDMKARSTLCSVCQNITETSPCYLCGDHGRDRTKICVVEEPLDLIALERARGYRGLYHVLHGVISPMDGIGPEQLKVRELLMRLQDPPARPGESPPPGGRAGSETGQAGEQVQEIIMATNPTVEGEATAMYLHRLISPLGIKVTRLARGLPAGADLEYADEVTLSQALENRQEVSL